MAKKRRKRKTAASRTGSATRRLQLPFGVAGFRWFMVVAVVVALATGGGLFYSQKVRPMVEERQLARASLKELEAKSIADPENARVCYYYAQALLAGGFPNEAAGVFARTVQLEPLKTRAYLGMARCMEALDLPAEAERAYKQAIERSPGELDPQMRLAQLYHENGQGQLAVKTLEGAVKIQPNDARVWYLLAHRYGDIQARVEALEALEKAVSLDAKVPAYQRDLGRAYWHFDRLEDAQRTLRKAVSMAPNDGYSHLWLGQVYARRPKSAESTMSAERELREAARVLPHRAEPFQELGGLMLRASLLEEAEKFLREAARLDAGNEEVRMQLGRLLSQRGQTQDARRFMNEAQRIVSSRREARALEERVRAHPKDAKSWLRLARLYRHPRAVPPAVEAYRRYLSLVPKDQAVAKELQDCRKLLSTAGQSP